MNFLRNISFTICLFICFSCSDSESTTANTFEEKVVGTWDLIDRIPHGIEYCELSNNLHFSGNGDLTVELSIGDSPEECQSGTRTGTWEYLGENQVEIDFNDAEENITVNITFSDGNTVLEMKSSSTDQVITEIYAKS